jgi:hypothetical protein
MGLWVMQLLLAVAALAVLAQALFHLVLIPF